MLTVTERAKEELKEILLAGSRGPEDRLRLALAGPGHVGVVLDREREGDQVVEYKGSKVLVVEARLAEALDPATLDFRDDEEGPHLFIYQSEGREDGASGWPEG